METRYAIISADTRAGGSHAQYREYQLDDGIVGEVIFPNTIPPFFPSFVLSAPPPMRQLFHSWSEPDLRRLLAGTVSTVYDFDLQALQPLADEWGPTVGEIREPLVELPENPNEALVRGPVG